MSLEKIITTEIARVQNGPLEIIESQLIAIATIIEAEFVDKKGNEIYTGYFDGRVQVISQAMTLIIENQKLLMAAPKT